MANQLSKTGITTGNTVRAWHVTQSIDAFNGTEAYDITLSGSLTYLDGTEGDDKILVNQLQESQDHLQVLLLVMVLISPE
jgi:hypothetical protein